MERAAARQQPEPRVAQLVRQRVHAGGPPAALVWRQPPLQAAGAWLVAAACRLIPCCLWIPPVLQSGCPKMRA